MAPRKAFIIGNLILGGIGIVFIGFFGWPIHHWFSTGEFLFMSRWGQLIYGQSPFAFTMEFAFDLLMVGLGFVRLAASIANPIYYWKKLVRE